MTTEMPIIDAGSLALLDILPRQGEWNEADYRWIVGTSDRLVELIYGRVEAVPMPSEKHQAIAIYLLWLLREVAKQIGGIAFIAPLTIKIGPRHFRQPDLLMLLQADDSRRSATLWTGADLVVEVVSPDKPERDTVDKVRDYAQAGIPEYWIVNPITERITVLTLADAEYKAHGDWGRGEIATSALLPDFSVDVSAVLDAE